MTPCLKCDITFDNSSVKRIFSDPSAILEDIQSFWEKEIPYQRAVEWAPIPINYGDFKFVLEEISKWELEERENHKYMHFANMIISRSSEFQESILPLIFSYLPPNTSICARIYLATFILLEQGLTPTAIVREGDIVLNVSAEEKWKNNVDVALNEIVHELYHIGFDTHLGHIRCDFPMTCHELIQNIIWQIQYEGMATYVSYKALPLLPNPVMKLDYQLLENPSEVEKFILKINSLISAAASNLPPEVVEQIIQSGIMERVFHVVGAHIAKTIEAKRGRKALIESISKGPKHFIDNYNIDAQNGMQVLLQAYS